MNTSYILLGSNLGDRKKYIASAISEISVTLGIIEISSSLYETASCV
jgi:7,8-dihydro-6-hydroxymethylpterin-pyrophosphokinase